MKRISLILCVLLLFCSGCAQKGQENEETGTSETALEITVATESEQSEAAQSEVPEALQLSTTVPEKETTQKETTTSFEKGQVYISSTGKAEQQWILLGESQANMVEGILNGCSFQINPLDNLNDYSIRCGNIQYGYDSENGILTYSNKNTPINQEKTAKLSRKSKEALNTLFAEVYSYIYECGGEVRESTTKPPKTFSGTTITEVFIIKKIEGKQCTLAKYDRNAGELKSGLYVGNIPDSDGSDAMNFGVGDVVTVRYNEEIAETCPYQITIKEIYLAVWN